MKGKATQKMKRNEKANNKWAATTTNNTLKTMTGRRGKNTY
jgi:hypothetical protein